MFAIVFGVNLMPAFGPPTWSIIVIYGLNTKMALPGLVLTSASAAASGRYLLAHAFRKARGHIPQRLRRNLEAAGRVLERRKRHMVLALGLFALSPVPSAQLFEAAGLAGTRLFSFTCAFFAGRLVSYSVYSLTAKSINTTSVGAAFQKSLSSPMGIGLQIAMIAMLIGLAQVDWDKKFKGDLN